MKEAENAALGTHSS